MAGILAVAGVLQVPEGSLLLVSAIADVPGVTNGVVGVSDVPFEHTVAGCPVVNGFPDVNGFSAVEGILAVANFPANPGVPILAGGYTYWIVE